MIDDFYKRCAHCARKRSIIGASGISLLFRELENAIEKVYPCEPLANLIGINLDVIF